MAGVSGSIRKLTLSGITFDVMHDSNVNEVGSAYENTMIPTSGTNMRKMVKRVEQRESVIVACNGEDRELLKSLAELTTDIPMSYATASGDVYRGMGTIEFAKRETEENRAELKLLPRKGWDPFLA